MVRDNVTGLIWETKQYRDGEENYSNPNDSDNRYSWYNRNLASSGGDPGTQGDGSDTEDFINTLNTGSGFCGHTDWRLPTIEELAKITCSSRIRPAAEIDFFPNTSWFNYWSSTVSVGDQHKAWYVHFTYASINSDYMSDKKAVRAVRSGNLESNERMIDNNDGTVTDPNSGLMWQKNEAGSMAWQNSLVYCEELELAGYDDWHLPDRNELQSLADYLISEPCLDKQFFPGVLSATYFSSTTFSEYKSNVWLVDFKDGNISNGCKTSNYFVRAVRNAQLESVDLTDPDGDSYPTGLYNYYLPYFKSGNGVWTGLGLTNRNKGDSTQLQVTVYDSSGNALSTEYKTIPAHGQDSFVVATQLNNSGWMQINSHQPLSGLAFLGSWSMPLLMADIPFISELSTCLIIPHIAQDVSWDTTILICNPNDETTSIDLKYVDKAGVEQGIQNYTILRFSAIKFQ